jgi:hypothetical protein
MTSRARIACSAGELLLDDLGAGRGEHTVAGVPAHPGDERAVVAGGGQGRIRLGRCERLGSDPRPEGAGTGRRGVRGVAQPRRRVIATAEADQGDRGEALQEREHLDVTGFRKLRAERLEPLEPLVDVGSLGAGLHEGGLHEVQEVPAGRGAEAPEARETAGAERIAHGQRRPSYLLEGVVLHPQLEERGGPLQPDQEAVDHD